MIWYFSSDFGASLKKTRRCIPRDVSDVSCALFSFSFLHLPFTRWHASGHFWPTMHDPKGKRLSDRCRIAACGSARRGKKQVSELKLGFTSYAAALSTTHQPTPVKSAVHCGFRKAGGGRSKCCASATFAANDLRREGHRDQCPQQEEGLQMSKYTFIDGYGNESPMRAIDQTDVSIKDCGTRTSMQ
jgi:hypothetical protein